MDKSSKKKTGNTAKSVPKTSPVTAASHYIKTTRQPSKSRYTSKRACKQPQQTAVPVKKMMGRPAKLQKSAPQSTPPQSATIPVQPATPTSPDPSTTTMNIFNTWLWLFVKMRNGVESPLSDIVQFCRNQFWWKTAVDLTSSLEHYEATLLRVTKDGKLSKGQRQVLEVYTRDVCAQHLPISTAVWTMYTSV